MLLKHLFYPLYVSFELIDTLYRVYLRDKRNIYNTIFGTIFDIEVVVEWVAICNIKKIEFCNFVTRIERPN